MTASRAAMPSSRCATMVILRQAGPFTTLCEGSCFSSRHLVSLRWAQNTSSLGQAQRRRGKLPLCNVVRPSQHYAWAPFMASNQLSSRRFSSHPVHTPTPSLSTTYTRQTPNAQQNECKNARKKATRHPTNIRGRTGALTSKWCREGPLGCGCTEPERHRCSCLKGYNLTRPHCSVPGPPYALETGEFRSITQTRNAF